MYYKLDGNIHAITNFARGIVAASFSFFLLKGYKIEDL